MTDDSGTEMSEESSERVVLTNEDDGLVKSYLKAIAMDFDLSETKWFMLPLKVAFVSLGPNGKVEILNNNALNIIFQGVANICLRIIIPCVDSEKKNNGWNRLLNTTQIVILPFILLVSSCRKYDSCLGRCVVVLKWEIFSR